MNREFGDYVRRTIREANLKQTEAAERIGITRQTLQNWMKGDVKSPKVETLARTADVLQCSTKFLLRLAYDKLDMSSGPKTKRKYKGDDSSFVEDMTIPDGELIMVGAEFEKIWKIQNSGNHAWLNRTLICIDQTMLNNFQVSEKIQRSLFLKPESTVVSVPDCQPMETVQVSVVFTAPRYPCGVISYWKMFDEEGDLCFPDYHGVYCRVNVTTV